MLIDGISPGVIDKPEADIVGSLCMWQLTQVGPVQILRSRIDRPMEGRAYISSWGPARPVWHFLHAFRARGPLPHGSVGGVTTVAFILDVMAALAEGLPERLGSGLVLAMLFHPAPGNRVSASLELLKLLSMASAADSCLHR